MRYKYKNIVCFQSGNSWVADYCDGNNRFALHRVTCRTKKLCHAVAVAEIDWLNFKDHKEGK